MLLTLAFMCYSSDRRLTPAVLGEKKLFRAGINQHAANLSDFWNRISNFVLDVEVFYVRKAMNGIVYHIRGWRGSIL